MHPVLIFILIVIVIGLLAYASWLAEKKRREALLQLAARLGLHFEPDRNDAIAERYQFLDALRQGDNRYACNVLSGTYRDRNVTGFDYHYETHSTDSKGRRQTTHHWFSFFILELDLGCPELRIYPENIFSKIGQALGYDDIDFESAEFSRKFTVRSPDKRFAYDIIHPRMMEYLLAHPNLSLEMEGSALAIGSNGRIKPEQIEAQLNILVEIRELFPAYLFNAPR